MIRSVLRNVVPDYIRFQESVKLFLEIVFRECGRETILTLHLLLRRGEEGFRQFRFPFFIVDVKHFVGDYWKSSSLGCEGKGAEV